MSLTIDKATFTEALAAVSSIVKGRVAHPVLNYVKLEATKDSEFASAQFTATDLDCFYRRSVDAEVTSEFSCLIPVRMVREWLATVSPGSLVIAINRQKLVLKCGAKKIEVATADVADFPKWPDFPLVETAKADLSPISAVMSAAPDSDARLELYDIPISYVSPNRLMACAANGTVLATHIFDGVAKESSTLHVTPPTIRHVSSLGPCQIADGPSFVGFFGAGFTLLSKKLAVKTIEFTTVLKGWKFVTTATLIREEFMGAIASCHVLRGTDENAFVTIEAEDGGLKIHCQNKHGEQSESIAARVEGAFTKIILPSSQLLAPLRVSEEEAVEFSLSDTARQAQLKMGATTFFVVGCFEEGGK